MELHSLQVPGARSKIGSGPITGTGVSSRQEALIGGALFPLIP